MIQIRKMEKKDILQVADLEQQIFSEPWSQKGFLDVVDRPDVLFLVAEENNIIAGYSGVYLAADEGEITNVAVALWARRKGIATRLLEIMKKRLQQQGIVKIILEVRVSNQPALLFYQKEGFQTEGTRKHFYQKPVEDAYIMICPL